MHTPSIQQNLEQIYAPLFNIELTLSSGQVFHWSRSGNGFTGLIESEPVYVEQHSESLLVTPGMEEKVRHYFALDHSLEEICASFPDDAAMNLARDFCKGLRIIRQPPWECAATFITSSMKQVSHIRQMSFAIRERFGQPLQFGKNRLFKYPTPEELSLATETDLRECKLGYRAKNLTATASMVARADVSLEKINTMDDDAAREELCRLPGIGAKVANCILLFAYGRLRAFPIDVWIARVLKESYFKGKRKITTRQLRDFSQSYFGEYGGYAQQYLFHYARSMRRK